jgi:hypothetical protein
MLHNPRKSFQPLREGQTSASEARRLRLEYGKLARRLAAIADQPEMEAEAQTLRGHVERIARELGLIRADSVHAVESKLKVAMERIGDLVDETSHKLLASALTDLHYLALLSAPAGPTVSEIRQKALADVAQRARIKGMLDDEDAGG